MSAHNFTVGAKQNKVQTPLTMEEVARRAPSALALRPYAAMSAKYTYVPTINIIEGMIKAGFQPFAASQSLTRIAARRLSRSTCCASGTPTWALWSWATLCPRSWSSTLDGACAFRLIAGLYRLVCSNGLMVSDAEIESISVRHTGNILQAVVDGSYTIVGNAAKALGTVKQWRQLQLTDGERHAFATSAHILRFADAEGKTTTPITPDQLLVPRRYDDQGKDLWTTFNVLQENALKGGLSGIQRDAEGRRVRSVSTRQIRGIDGNVQLNRSLWTLAERLAELKGKDVPFSEAEVVEAAA